jgi:hypothetical protein
VVSFLCTMNRHIVLLLWTEQGTSKRRSLPVVLAHHSLFSSLLVTQLSGWHRLLIGFLAALVGIASSILRLSIIAGLIFIILSSILL